MVFKRGRLILFNFVFNMQMGEEIISRSRDTIGKEDYLKLFALNRDCEWLSCDQDALYDLWCLAENNEQKSLIEHLIKNFLVIDGRKLVVSCKNLSSQIENVWSLKAVNTYLIAVCDDDKPDGSQSLLQSLKNKFSVHWKESNFYNSLPIGASKISSDSNIILVDDFIGTGDTIQRKLKYLKDKIEERNLTNISIRIICLAAMNFTKSLLDELSVEYYSEYWLSKGISELLQNDSQEVAIESMVALEKKLQKKYHGRQLPNFGYKKSEAIYTLEGYNIPNNVFPIFWWPFLKGGIPRQTFFKRL